MFCYGEIWTIYWIVAWLTYYDYLLLLCFSSPYPNHVYELVCLKTKECFYSLSVFFLFWYKMNQLVICLVVGLHTCSFPAEICCGSLQSKYAVRFTFILFLIILFYNVQMLAFHVSSRASRQRSWKKHSSSSLELVLGVMKPFRLILFVCVM